VVPEPGGASAPDTLGLLRLLRATSTEFQLPRRLYYLVKRVTPPIEPELLETIPLRSDYRRLVDLRRQGPVTTDVPPVPTRAYGANLRSPSAAHANQVRVVLMTQQTTWASTVDPGVEEWQDAASRREDADDADHGSGARGAECRREAGSRGTPGPSCTTARSIPKSSEHFSTTTHFNLRGARRRRELARGDPRGARCTRASNAITERNSPSIVTGRTVGCRHVVLLCYAGHISLNAPHPQGSRAVARARRAPSTATGRSSHPIKRPAAEPLAGSAAARRRTVPWPPYSGLCSATAPRIGN
jgi:hypothetical protein